MAISCIHTATATKIDWAPLLNATVAVGPRSPLGYNRVGRQQIGVEGCGWPPISPRLQSGRPPADRRRRLRLAPDLPSATITAMAGPSCCSCGWPPISPRLQFPAVLLVTKLVAVGPRSPLGYNAGTLTTTASALRLAPDLPSATMKGQTPCPRWRCGWPPISPRLQLLGCWANLEIGLAHSWVLAKKLHLSASK